jgi:serine phosphatase RsbU (regulator of sigma subunit)
LADGGTVEVMNRARTTARHRGGAQGARNAGLAFPLGAEPAAASGKYSGVGVGPAERIRTLEDQRAAFEEENRLLNEAIYGAAQLQRILLPPREVRRGRFEIASEIFPARYLSGDFYDVQDCAGAVSLAVGDIAGKGLVAGSWFTYWVGLIRRHAEALHDPAGVAAAANHDLMRFHGVSPTAALFMARLEPESRELAYCNAGQPAAILIRGDRTVESLHEGGPILGAIPEAQFASGKTVFSPGDTLIIYSDGIPECRNARDREFGSERLLAAALDARGPSAGAVLFSILAAVQDFAGGCVQSDDLTLMVIHQR